MMDTSDMTLKFRSDGKNISFNTYYKLTSLLKLKTGWNSLVNPEVFYIIRNEKIWIQVDDIVTNNYSAICAIPDSMTVTSLLHSCIEGRDRVELLILKLILKYFH